MSNSKQNGLLGGLMGGGKTEKKEPYYGKFLLTPFCITFDGISILTSNVSKFEKYGIKRDSKITIVHWFILAFLAFAAFSVKHMIGNIAGVFCILAIVYGIWERYFKPKQHGLTIELNSGTRHYFINTDVNGINALFDLITKAIEMEGPKQILAKFEMGKVTIVNVGNNDGTVNIGDDYSTNTFK